MIRPIRTLAAAAILCGAWQGLAAQPGDPSPVDAVDPFIGTRGEGHTYRRHAEERDC